ncbi:2,3-diaminopropionate biosynthesis protein SbnB [Azospirillum thermophilum]|uniref:2,3-diaminopropionate biosynthesis protein SbnB n=1 Tax=Azospirillum thermophilum TaxID=2202148 RepID=A0A2S2CV32_9PROT|nr:2,3-diaminopropionate biosynthesis protein SbnB [Azospirillum thermophilum]AWK88329.1 2,3-diaminopropionate biosynthesis protein SbnB [Azospirillum thermophilum]
MMSGPEQRFDVVGADAIADILASSRAEVVSLVREAYLAHHAGRTINPDSYFLRFPDRPSARIIALPARLQDGQDVAGIKWISSFPENHGRGLARASAVVVLNDMATGFPYACLEGSHISAARTAASAVLAAELLHGGKRARTVAIVGAGPIAATHVDYLLETGWDVGGFRLADLVAERAEAFRDRLRARGQQAETAATVEQAVRGADLVLFATTAPRPYLDDPALFTAEQTVLHVSLRDLGVPVILSGQNVVDDVEHCLKAQTSVHLAEQQTGGRGFIAGTIADLLTGRVRPDAGRVRLFSPFGLGVLDLAVARFIHSRAVDEGRGIAIPGFFAAP